MAEMAVFMPVSGSFIRMGSKWVDEAFGFMLGWNFFLYGTPNLNLPNHLSDFICERIGLIEIQRLSLYPGKSAR